VTITQQARAREAGNGDLSTAEHPARAYIDEIAARGIVIVDGKSIPLVRDNSGRPGTQISSDIYVFTRIVKRVSAGISFAEAVRVRPDGTGLETRDDGKACRFVIRLAAGKTKSTVIHEGIITVTNRNTAYEPTADRRLIPAEHSDYVTVRNENRAGKIWECRLTGMQFLRSLTQSPEWVDRLGLTGAIRLSDVKTYIRTQFDDFDGRWLIQGQGSMYLPDGTPVFACNSVVFDTSGKCHDIETDLTDIPKTCDYYDVTPIAKIKDDDITAGCQELIAAYSESPAHPEIPAAFLGQLFTGPVAATHIQYFTATFLSGERGSGKSLLAMRYDAIQSRTLRGDLRSIRPALNLGDTTGTTKGPKYRVAPLGGFTITADDVIKSGMTALEISSQSKIVSDLIRSLEKGGASLAHVDRSRNKVHGSQAPELHSSIRFTSEKPVIGESTLDRLIMLPHLTASWGRGEIFDTAISKRLSAPGSIELQHRAWSAFVYWLYQRVDTGLAECYSEAVDETRTWDISARNIDRYSAIIAGHYAFARFCAEHDIDVSEPVRLAVLALRECAKRQATLSVPLAQRFRDAVTPLRTGGKASFPGPPVPDPDGIVSSSYSAPWKIHTVNHKDGTSEDKRIMPPGIDFRDLGLHIDRGNPVPKGSVLGYVIPPRTDRGGHKGNELARRWLIAMKQDQFHEICRLASRDGQQYSPRDVMESLRQENLGDIMRIRIPKQERMHVIDLGWLCNPGDTE
jgi:hypothetical protein